MSTRPPPLLTLTLIRHGQASYGAQNYDQLSPHGHHQMRALGAWWRSNLSANPTGPLPKNSSWVIGKLNRHLESLESFALGGEWGCQSAQDLVDRSLSSHEIKYSIDAGWNEFDFKRILSELSSQLDAEPQGRRVSAKGGMDLFEYHMFKWMSGRASLSYLSWLEFQAQSLRSLIKLGELRPEGIDTFRSSPSVICITSAGVITAILTACLKLDPRQSFSTLMKIYNSSITQIEWSALPSFDEFERRCDSNDSDPNSPEMSERYDGFMGSLRSFNVTPQLKESERTFY